MKIIRKIFIALMIGLTISVLNFSNARISPLNPQETPEVIAPQISGSMITENIEEGNWELSYRLNGILIFPHKDQYTTSLGYALGLIQVAINWILGMLAVVSLVYMLYCGFLVFASGSDDKNAQKGKKGIATAAIALAGIGLSWLIISAMIWLINLWSGQ